jgi:hypothetical protein
MLQHAEAASKAKKLAKVAYEAAMAREKECAALKAHRSLSQLFLSQGYSPGEASKKAGAVIMDAKVRAEAEEAAAAFKMQEAHKHHATMALKRLYGASAASGAVSASSPSTPSRTGSQRQRGPDSQ